MGKWGNGIKKSNHFVGPGLQPDPFVACADPAGRMRRSMWESRCPPVRIVHQSGLDCFCSLYLPTYSSAKADPPRLQAIAGAVALVHPLQYPAIPYHVRPAGLLLLPGGPVKDPFSLPHGSHLRSCVPTLGSPIPPSTGRKRDEKSLAPSIRFLVSHLSPRFTRSQPMTLDSILSTIMDGNCLEIMVGDDVNP